MKKKINPCTACSCEECKDHYDFVYKGFEEQNKIIKQILDHILSIDMVLSSKDLIIEEKAKS